MAKNMNKLFFIAGFFLLSFYSSHAQGPDLLTWHNGNARLGSNVQETVLTLKNVNSDSFGKIDFKKTDGAVDAQVLYVGNVGIRGAQYSVLYAASENDSVYAYAAGTGATLWKVSLLRSGETAGDTYGCSSPTQVGITSTPVIDLGKGPNGAIYVVSMSKDSSGNYHQRLNALDLSTGAQLFGGPTEIQATYPGTGANSSNGKVVFAPAHYTERAALLEWEGDIYTTWASHCDATPYTGWILAYSATTLRQTHVHNLTPNGSDGGIWMSGAGPAANQNRIMLLDGNGTFDTNLNKSGMPVNGNFGNAFINLAKDSNNGVYIEDYYATDNTVQQSSVDTDLGSGGVMILPNVSDKSGMVHYLAVGAGKDTNIYVVDRLNMGKYHPNGGSIYQTVSGVLPSGVYGAAAYFDNKVYYAGKADNVKAFAISNAKLETTPTSASTITLPYPGATLSISSNNGNNGIVWAVAGSASEEATLYALSAEDLSKELYDSTQAGTRDQWGPSNKFTTPTIVAGKVYVGSPTGIVVFGLF